MVPTGIVSYIHYARAHCHLQRFVSINTALLHMQQQFPSCTDNASEIKTSLKLSRKAWCFPEVSQGMPSSHTSLQKLLSNLLFHLEDKYLTPPGEW